MTIDERTHDPMQPFEGIPVVSSGFTMPGASGGLNAALTVNNLELHKDDEIVLAISCKVRALNFPPVKDTDGVQRVHVLDVKGVAVIDEDTVAEALEAQRVRVEEAQGIKRLPPGDADVYSDDDEPDDPGDAPAE
jgi:hypothetical protein